MRAEDSLLAHTTEYVIVLSMGSSPAAVRSSMAYHQARAQRLQEELERAQQALARQERDTQIWQAQASRLMEAWTDSEARADAATAAAAGDGVGGGARSGADTGATPPHQMKALSRDSSPQHRNPAHRTRDRDTKLRTRDRDTKPRPAWEPRGYSPPESSLHPAPDTAVPDRHGSESSPRRLDAAAQREVALDAKAERLRQFERSLQRREAALCRREQDAELAAAKLEEIADEIARREQLLLASSRATGTHQRAAGRSSADDREEVSFHTTQQSVGSRDRSCASGSKRRLGAIGTAAAADHGLDCKRRLGVAAGGGTHAKSVTFSPGAKPVGGTPGGAQRSWRP